MFLFPIVLIVVMGVSLNGLMNVDKSIFENKKVYYKINGLDINEKYLNVFYNFKDSCEESIKIKFEKFEDENKAKKFVNEGDSLAFISIDKDSYNYHTSEKTETSEQKIFKNVFEQYLDKYSLIESLPKNTIKEIINKEKR